jgi:hypothetical protein
MDESFISSVPVQSSIVLHTSCACLPNNLYFLETNIYESKCFDYMCNVRLLPVHSTYSGVLCNHGAYT